MLNSHFETTENMKKYVPLIPINKNSKINNSGVYMCYDEENIYIDKKFNNNLVIGESGSGKTQAVTLPLLKTSLLATESVIVTDLGGDIYKTMHDEFEKNGYTNLVLNFDNPRNGDRWNPFSLITKLYKNKDYDLAQEAIENLGFSLIRERTDNTNDPFWENSAVNFFSGLVLYALENNIDLTFDALQDIENKIDENSSEFINSLDKKDPSYINLVGILNAPNETRGSIISVFNQKIKSFFSKIDLKNMLSDDNFDYDNLLNNKTIVYLVPGLTTVSERLMSLFVSQFAYVKRIFKSTLKYNIILDDFYNMNYIKNIVNIVNNSKSFGMKFTITVGGFNEINNIYGKEQANLLKACFNNIIYLLSSDIETLEEVSKMCGNKSSDGKMLPLVSVSELKTLKMFEVIILAQRVMPYKTKLCPYYKLTENGIF